MATTEHKHVTISSLPPELIAQIALGLQHSDLFHCTLTNREWHLIFTPQLWRFIKTDLCTHTLLKPSRIKSALPTLQKFKTSIASGGLVENGHLVEALHLGYYEVLELLGSSTSLSAGCGKEVEEVEAGSWTAEKQHTDDNDNKNNKDDKSAREESGNSDRQSTREFKSMCTNLLRLHVGSGFDPADRNFGTMYSEISPTTATTATTTTTTRTPSAAGNAFAFGTATPETIASLFGNTSGSAAGTTANFGTMSDFGDTTASGTEGSSFGFGAGTATSGIRASTSESSASTSGSGASTSRSGDSTSGSGASTSGSAASTSGFGGTSGSGGNGSGFGNSTNTGFGNSSTFGFGTISSAGFGTIGSAGFGTIGSVGFGGTTSGFGSTTLDFGSTTTGVGTGTSGFGGGSSFGGGTTSSFGTATSGSGSGTSGIGTTSGFGGTPGFGSTSGFGGSTTAGLGNSSGTGFSSTTFGLGSIASALESITSEFGTTAGFGSTTTSGLGTTAGFGSTTTSGLGTTAGFGSTTTSGFGTTVGFGGTTSGSGSTSGATSGFGSAISGVGTGTSGFGGAAGFGGGTTATTTTGFGGITSAFSTPTSGFGSVTSGIGTTSGFGSTSGFGGGTISGFGIGSSRTILGPASASGFGNTAGFGAASGFGSTSGFGNTAGTGTTTSTADGSESLTLNAPTLALSTDPTPTVLSGPALGTTALVTGASAMTPFGARPTFTPDDNNTSLILAGPPVDNNTWRIRPIPPQRNQLIDHPIDLSFLVSLLHQNNQLRQLSLKGRLLDYFGGVVGDLADVFSVLPASLVSLRFNGFRGSSLNPMARLTVEQRRAIEEKEEKGEEGSSSRRRRRWSPPLPSPLPKPQTLHALRKIRILSCRIRDSLLVSLFERSPNLQSLRIAAAKNHVIRADITNALRNSCPRLNELTLSGELGTDEDLARMISASTAGWVTLAIPALKPYLFDLYGPTHNEEPRSPFGPLSTAALFEHASTLENLLMDKCPGFVSRDVHRLLCSAPRLRRLMLMSLTYQSGNGAYLHAHDLMDISKSEQQWACRSLEEFSCEIVGVPRPDIGLGVAAQVDPLTPHSQLALEASYAVHRKIYSRFARLPHLNRLVLGKGQSGGASSVHSGSYLSMSLESGLNILGDLKELQIVDCDELTTKFWTDPVQQWAKDHWPQYNKKGDQPQPLYTFWQLAGCWDRGVPTIDDPFHDFM